MVDVNEDVNSRPIVYDAKEYGGKTASWILGGGSPKNFLCRPSRRSRRCSGCRRRPRLLLQSRTPAPTPAASPAPLRG